MLVHRLPLTGLPTASKLLAEACAEVAADADARWRVGAAMLENYLIYLLAQAPEPERRLTA